MKMTSQDILLERSPFPSFPCQILGFLDRFPCPLILSHPTYPPWFTFSLFLMPFLLFLVIDLAFVPLKIQIEAKLDLAGKWSDLSISPLN